MIRLGVNIDHVATVRQARRGHEPVPVESVALNALGTVRVLEAARRADAGRVILASTVWVYSATHGQVVDEDTPFDLQADKHIYVSEKLAAEMFCA